MNLDFHSKATGGGVFRERARPPARYRDASESSPLHCFFSLWSPPKTNQKSKGETNWRLFGGSGNDQNGGSGYRSYVRHTWQSIWCLWPIRSSAAWWRNALQNRARRSSNNTGVFLCSFRLMLARFRRFRSVRKRPERSGLPARCRCSKRTGVTVCAAVKSASPATSRFFT